MNMGDFPPNTMEHNGLPRNLNGICKPPAYVLPVDVNNENDQCEDASNQLVLYSPPDASNTDHDVLAAPDTTMDHIGPFQSSFEVDPSIRVLPSVGAFTVQCAACFKWRFVPTKEKYEEIRESILQQPFVCARARAWRPNISCDDPADISQDGSRLWAIDKPNIAQPPPGWERLLRIRGEGSTKFADIYYVAPSGKRLRSMVEIQKYLLDHPEYIRNGVHLAQFSFQIPKPLQENYVRKKRPAKTTNFNDAAAPPLSIPIGPCEVNPIAWATPPTCTELQLGGPGLSTPYTEPPVYHPPVQARPVLPTPYSKPPVYQYPVKHEPGVPTPYSEPPLQFQQLPTPYSEPPVYQHPVEHEPGLSTPYSEPPLYQPPVQSRPGLPTPCLEPPLYQHPVKHEPGLSISYSEAPVHQPGIQSRPGLPTPCPEPPVCQHPVKHEPGLSTHYSEAPVYQPPVDPGPGLATPYSEPPVHRGPGLSTPYSGPTLYQPPVEPRPRKKRAVRAPAKTASTSSVCDQQEIKDEDHQQGSI